MSMKKEGSSGFCVDVIPACPESFCYINAKVSKASREKICRAVLPGLSRVSGHLSGLFRRIPDKRE
jgi:hypothetical protein